MDEANDHRASGMNRSSIVRFVVLALIVQRAGGMPFERLVVERVCEPAGMAATGLLRSDELPGDVARAAGLHPRGD